VRSTDLGRASRRPSRRRHSPREDGRALAKCGHSKPAAAGRNVVRRRAAALFKRMTARFVAHGYPASATTSSAQVGSRRWRALHAHIIRDGMRCTSASDRRHYLSDDGWERSGRHQASAPASRPIPIRVRSVPCTRSRRHGRRARPALHAEPNGGWADWTGPGGPRPDIGVLRSDDHGLLVAIDRQGLAVGLSDISQSSSTRTTPIGVRHALEAATRSVQAAGNPRLWVES